MATAVEGPLPPTPALRPDAPPAEATQKPLPTAKGEAPPATAEANGPTATPGLAFDAPPQTAPAAADGSSADPPDGVRYTPFAHPAAAARAPDPAPLTNEQQTMYNSVHNIVSAWTTVPVSTAADAEHAPITEAEQQWLTRECLLRYLRAVKWRPSDAVLRLQGTLAWRREYDLAGLTPESTSVENETGKQWLLGYDREGRPCLYLNPARQNTPRSDKQIRHLVFMLERGLDLLPGGQETLVLLINFAESSKGQGASFQQGQQTLHILQNHYPERLGKALLCNLPWHFWAFMKLVTPFIDPLTRKKIIYNEDMQTHVPAEQLRRSHGGTLEFEYEHARYWPALNELAEARRRAQYERWVRGGKRVGEFEAYLKGGQEECLADTQKRAPSPQRKGSAEKGDAESQSKKSVSIQEGASKAANGA